MSDTAATVDGNLPWPSEGQTPNFVTTFTCGHRGLLADWTYPIIGQGQHCEVCDEPRTIIDVGAIDD